MTEEVRLSSFDGWEKKDNDWIASFGLNFSGQGEKKGMSKIFLDATGVTEFLMSEERVWSAEESKLLRDASNTHPEYMHIIQDVALTK